MADQIKFTIEEDGTITTETDKVSPVNHKSADDFLRYVKTLAGGAVKVTKKTPHGHSHHKNEQKVGR